MTNLEKSGFSAQRLENVSDYLQRLVDTRQTAGVGAYIARRGAEVYYKSFGFQDIENSIPMRNDSLYRIYSMTKTFTIVTAMTLYEKGLFKLHDPIAAFLPAFAGVQVARHDERGVLQIVKAKCPITFEHLFTMTSGIPYPGNDSYSARVFAELQAKTDMNTLTAVQAADMAARVPLCFHPGEHWMYGFSHDILGCLIEILSGKTLGEYMKEVIFEPLNLCDTGFYVPEEKQGRLTKVYGVTEQGLVQLKNLTEDHAATVPPLFEMGGAGLVSTLRDVGRYARMLLNKGSLEGTRVLSRKTIELIRQNHCLESQDVPRFGFSGMAGYGYGLGVRTMIDTSAAGLNGSFGEWAWDGMLGTWYCVDPVEDMIAVFMVQRHPGGNDDLPKRFAQTVYGAIND
ncbi:MAG: beta-lactamase family protein [Treponema sp.]|jgi:CubicO group peptidase (beta-lactamase class C family)|nr:beta-lactamase family protein [Treponema sp.]